MSTYVDQPTHWLTALGTNARAIEWAADIWDFKDTPTITRFGLGGLGRVTGTELASKMEWYEGTMRARSFSPTVQLADGAGDLTLTVGAANNPLLRPGVILRNTLASGPANTAKDELIRVTAQVSAAAGTWTITRDWAGAGDRDVHETTETLEIIGQVVADRADPTYSGLLNHTLKVQYSSLMNDGVDLSFKELHQAKEGTGKPTLATRLADLMPELQQELDRSFIYNIQKAGSASDMLTSFGGFEWYWPDTGANVTDALNAKPTYEIIEDAYVACVERGGKPNLLMCRPGVIRDIAKDIRNNGFAQLTMTDSQTRAGVRYETLRFQDGDVELVPNRHMPLGKAYLMQEDLIGLGAIVPWTQLDIAPNGSLYSRRAVVGEFSMAIKFAAEAHQKIINLA